MADRDSPLSIGRLRVRASSARAAHELAAQFSGAVQSIPMSAVQPAQRVTLRAAGDSPGRSAARALAAHLSGGRDG